jgi:hypothetical protein
MSDETTTPEAVEIPTDAPEPTPTEAPDLGDAGKKAIAAERAARKAAEKAAAELAARVKEFEDASKSEAEKAAARAEAAEKALAEMTQRALRLQVATETGLDPSLHEFLTGSDEESLRSQAEKLKAATASQRATPRPDPTQGAKPNANGPTQLTKADLASMTPAQIDQALTEGRLVDVLAGRA